MEEIKTTVTAEAETAANEPTEAAAEPAVTEAAVPAAETKPAAAPETMTAAEQKAVDKTAEDRVSVLEGKLAAMDAGVPKENAEDVLTLARAEMTKNGGTLEIAIAAVMAKYPALKGAEPASITTSSPTPNDPPNDDAEVKEVMGIK